MSKKNTDYIQIIRKNQNFKGLVKFVFGLLLQGAYIGRARNQDRPSSKFFCGPPSFPHCFSIKITKIYRPSYSGQPLRDRKVSPVRFLARPYTRPLEYLFLNVVLDIVLTIGYHGKKINFQKKIVPKFNN